MIFHIYSVNGVKVTEFLGYKSFTEAETGKTVLFPSGTEFLVCKVETTQESEGKNKVTHIYLRNL